MLVNTTDKDVEITTSFGLQFAVFSVDEQHMLDKVETHPAKLTVAPHQVLLLTNKEM